MSPVRTVTYVSGPDPLKTGGGGGIRTPETLSGLTVFKTAGFNRSPTPPSLIITASSSHPPKLSCRQSREGSSFKSSNIHLVFGLSSRAAFSSSLLMAVDLFLGIITVLEYQDD